MAANQHDHDDASVAENVSTSVPAVSPVVTTPVTTVNLVEDASVESTQDRLARVISIPRRSNRGRKRAPEITLNETTMPKVIKRKKATMKKQYAASTKTVYVGYIRTINEWYAQYHPTICDPRTGLIDRKIFYNLIQNKDSLLKEVDIFHTFLQTRCHARLKKKDGVTPARALIGSLNGFRSGFAYYMWGAVGNGIDHQWDAEMKRIYQSLNNEEGERKQKGKIPMKEGKDKLQWDLFDKLSRFFSKEGDVQSGFTNSWAWQLMCRAMNISTLTASALSWAGDCIAVQYGKTKMDRKGHSTILKHVYANPYRPEVCVEHFRLLCL